MAVKGEISFKSEVHGELEGPRENKTSLIYEFSHEVYLPHEREENRTQGARRIMPFEIVKYIDRTTPLLYQIVCEGVVCSEVKITLFHIEEATGLEVAYFNYLLENARIISVKDWMPPIYVPDTEVIGHLEKVKILARRVTWEYLDGGITFMDEAF
ncbi:MAG: type VI secretion system tube protein Hcp [Ignavibacteriales bacterium]|nr:MAG: type VI secretion system tube protein Hcp [Ignavibacteriales bacterium]